MFVCRVAYEQTWTCCLWLCHMKPSDCSQKGFFFFLQVHRTAELRQVHQDQSRHHIKCGETHTGSEDIEVTLTGSPNLLLQPCLFTCAHDTACAPLRGNQSSTRFTATEWNTVILYQNHSLRGAGPQASENKSEGGERK